MSPSKHIVLVAGEASGDLHGAHLVEALKQKDASLTFSGLGGPKMQQAGVEIHCDMTKTAVMGFTEVLKHYPHFKKIFDKIVIKIAAVKPAALILIDYPGFNLRLAKKIKSLKRLKDTKIIYFISPQVWAWKEKRVHTIKKCVDEMLVLFPFEKEFYKRFNYNVHCVGHPLSDIVTVKNDKTAFLTKHNLRDYATTIGLLPGSRVREIESLLPPMLDAAQIITDARPMTQFLIPKAPSIDGALIDRYLHGRKINVHVIENDTYDTINACDCCMVTSGTATLETALLEKPMVIIYKTSAITYMLAKMFVKIPDIGLVNIVAGKRIVPECVQAQVTGKRIAEELTKFIADDDYFEETRQEIVRVKKLLGEPGALTRAAEFIVEKI